MHHNEEQADRPAPRYFGADSAVAAQAPPAGPGLRYVRIDPDGTVTVGTAALGVTEGQARTWIPGHVQGTSLRDNAAVALHAIGRDGSANPRATLVCRAMAEHPAQFPRLIHGTALIFGTVAERLVTVPGWVLGWCTAPELPIATARRATREDLMQALGNSRRERLPSSPELAPEPGSGWWFVQLLAILDGCPTSSGPPFARCRLFGASHGPLTVDMRLRDYLALAPSVSAGPPLVRRVAPDDALPDRWVPWR